MKVAVLFSGGKDSAFALWCVQMQGWEITNIVTVFPESRESWMFHYPGVTWTRLQAEALGIPQTIIRTRGVKEEELMDLSSGLGALVKSEGIETVVSGALASEYQRTRLDNIGEALGLKTFCPLWHKKQEQLVRDQIESGFRIIVTACSTLGLDAKWLGRELNEDALNELVRLNKRYGLSVAFEGGEAETFVTEAPNFNGKLSIVRSTPHWRGDSGQLSLEEVRLETLA